jgi:hypothetical protein
MTIVFLLCLAWGMVASFFVLLVMIGARPVPTPPSIKSKSAWAHQLRMSKTVLHAGSTFVLNPRRSNSF